MIHLRPHFFYQFHFGSDIDRAGQKRPTRDLFRPARSRAPEQGENMQTKKVSPMCTKHDEASCTLNSSPEKLYKLSDSV